MRWRRPLFSRADTRVDRVIISTPDKILLNAFMGRALCNSTGAGVSNAMNRELSRSSESNQAPFRIISPWW